MRSPMSDAGCMRRNQTSTCISTLLLMMALLVGSERATAGAHYAASPNHVELARAGLQLALRAGFSEARISITDLQSRLEAGAYCEDFDPIPGVVGAFYPDPWDKFPELKLGDLLSVLKIPSGNLIDLSSGWARGLPHGYDPLNGFRWPGASMTTIQWANATANAFTWDAAVRHYQEGRYAEAYECLGHLIHLLTDLSIPAHVKVVDHGVHLSVRKNGYLVDPDIAAIIIDEYEAALQGGLEINGVTNAIPDLLGVFRTALSRAQVEDIPISRSWSELSADLATYTATFSLVAKYYAGPGAEGLSGQCRDGNGAIVLPAQLGSISPPVKIGDRWTQFGVFSTVKIPGGTVLPPSGMQTLCDSLVPRAVASAAALILSFEDAVRKPTALDHGLNAPARWLLEQNYPNPFNPSTTIRFGLPQRSHVTLTVFNTLGQQVAQLVNAELEAGYHDAVFEPTHLASGVYFYRMQVRGSDSPPASLANDGRAGASPRDSKGGANEYVQTRRLLLLR